MKTWWQTFCWKSGVSWYLLNARGCQVRVQHVRTFPILSSLLFLLNLFHEMSSQSSLPSSLADLQQPHGSLHRHGLNCDLLNQIQTFTVFATQQDIILHALTVIVLNILKFILEDSEVHLFLRFTRCLWHCAYRFMFLMPSRRQNMSQHLFSLLECPHSLPYKITWNRHLKILLK